MEMEQVIANLADTIFDLIKIEPDKSMEEELEKGEIEFLKIDFELKFHYFDFKKIIEKYYMRLAKKYAEFMFGLGIKIGVNFKDNVKDLQIKK